MVMSSTVEKFLLRSRKTFWDRKYDPNLQSFLLEYGRQDFALESRKSSQLASLVNEKIYWYPLPPERLRSLGACPKKNVFKSLSLERQKMPHWVVGLFAYMIDLQSGMENMTPTSNLYYTNLKNSKV